MRGLENSRTKRKVQADYLGLCPPVSVLWNVVHDPGSDPPQYSDLPVGISRVWTRRIEKRRSPPMINSFDRQGTFVIG